jgi:hypothetical protein
VALSQHHHHHGFIGENVSKRENRRRSFGGLYPHTHTPMDGMGGKQVTEYEGAITFFGGIVVFMSRKNYYHFPLDEE